MALFFDESPSTSLCASTSGYNSALTAEDTDELRGESSNTKMSEIQEHPTSPTLSVDEISRRMQELVEKINTSRTNDQKVLEEFEEKIVEKVSEVCQQMKEQLYAVYEDNNNKMQVKLQELTEVLESCSKVNQELMEASQALIGLREDLAFDDIPVSHF